MKDGRALCPRARFAVGESLPDYFLWAEFFSCMEKAMIPLPQGMQNLILAENIQGVRYINTLQIHPIYKQGLTFEMVFCAEAYGTSCIRWAMRQHVLQSKELNCGISGQQELVSVATFFWCICWETMLEGTELHHFFGYWSVTTITDIPLSGPERCSWTSEDIAM